MITSLYIVNEKPDSDLGNEEVSLDEQSSLLGKTKTVFKKAICNAYVFSSIACFTCLPLIGCISYAIQYKAPLRGLEVGGILAIPATIFALCVVAYIDRKIGCDIIVAKLMAK